jgi:hypothetical protein
VSVVYCQRFGEKGLGAIACSSWRIKCMHACDASEIEAWMFTGRGVTSELFHEVCITLLDVIRKGWRRGGTVIQCYYRS